MTLVVGAGIGLGLAALATLSTGQGGEAERRIKELKQTAAIQYATDYQFSEIVKTEQSNNQDQAEFPTNLGLLSDSKIDKSDDDLELTCLGTLPQESDTPLSEATVAKAEKKSIPGLSDEFVYTALEHTGRTLTAATLGPNDTIRLEALNELAYDRLMLDVWFRIGDLSKKADHVPILSIKEKIGDNDEKTHIRLLSVARNCDNYGVTGCDGHSVGFDHRVQQWIKNASGGDPIKWQSLHEWETEGKKLKHETWVYADADETWQYVNFYIDIQESKVEINARSADSSTWITRADESDVYFNDADLSEDDGYQPITSIGKDFFITVGDHATAENSQMDVEIGSVRVWRQPNILMASAAQISNDLFKLDTDEPGNFHTTSLGEPTTTVLFFDELDTSAEATIKPVWVPSRGHAIIASSTSSQILFESVELAQGFEGYPPGPTQNYRLYTCDGKGGGSRKKLVRKVRRDGDRFSVSWNFAE